MSEAILTPRARSWAFIGAAGILAAGVAAILNPGVQQALFDRAASELTAISNTAPLADDALRVAVCGTSAPLPSTARAKACVAVFAGGKFYVVDTGPESVENLMLWNVPMSEIGGVFITHFHSDHIGDLGELQLQSWAGRRPQPLDVYGGPGIEDVVAGFNAAYAQDQAYRTGHHGESIMPSATWGMVPHVVTLDGGPTPAKDRSGVAYDDGELRVTAIEVDHAPIEPAYAYRFDYKGRSVVITGDYKAHPPLALAAAGADLLVSEALSRSMTSSLETAARSSGRGQVETIMHDIQDYHISPEEAAAIANEAGVGLLVYYHLSPAPDNFLMRRLFANGVNAVRADGWTIAEDGSLYTLPLDSKEIQVGRIEALP
jgi:ribonuclease Z